MSTTQVNGERVSPNPVELVLGTALSYLLSRSLHVATELGLADVLADGPKSAAELAAKTGTHEPSLRRLLQTLSAQGIFAQDESGAFVNTPASHLLSQGILRDGVLLCGDVAGDGSFWNAVGALGKSIKTGEPAFELLHGMSFFEYTNQNPLCREFFDRGMATFAQAENPALAEAYEYGAFGHVVDVGGGQGGLLVEILKRNPQVRATLFDLPEVVEGQSRFGSPRFATEGGDFFESVPRAADGYLLKRILHDWSDQDCIRILRRVRQAMSPTSRLLVMDAVLPEGNAPHPGKVMDILMMVFAKGRERTETEFFALFGEADLRLRRIFPSASALSILEAVPR